MMNNQSWPDLTESPDELDITKRPWPFPEKKDDPDEVLWEKIPPPKSPFPDSVYNELTYGSSFGG